MRVSFQGVVQSREVFTFCTACQKKLRRKIRTEYFRNGFHDEAKTRAENEKNLNRELVRLEKHGTLCRNCLNAELDDVTEQLRKLRIAGKRDSVFEKLTFRQKVLRLIDAKVFDPEHVAKGS